MVGRANSVPLKSWGRPSGKNGGQKLLHLFGFSTTSRLNGEYLQLRFEAPEDVKMEMLLRRAALSGNTSL